MKIFSESKKSWSIKLDNDPNGKTVNLNAVDSLTGEFITFVLFFNIDGSVETNPTLYEKLLANGYNPKEHKNDFTEKGSIVIRNY